jgi:hypothetical protein
MQRQLPVLDLQLQCLPLLQVVLLHEGHLLGHGCGDDELLVLAKLEEALALELLDGAVRILLHLQLLLDLMR